MLDRIRNDSIAPRPIRLYLRSMGVFARLLIVVVLFAAEGAFSQVAAPTNAPAATAAAAEEAYNLSLVVQKMETYVAAKDLAIGDVIRIRPGDNVAADGVGFAVDRSVLPLVAEQRGLVHVARDVVDREALDHARAGERRHEDRVVVFYLRRPSGNAHSGHGQNRSRDRIPDGRCPE